MLLAMAHGSKAHRYAAYGKCGACALTVRAFTWAEPGLKQSKWTVYAWRRVGPLARRGLQGDLRCFGGALRLRDYPESVHPGYQEPSAGACCLPRAKKLAATLSAARSAAGGNASRDGAEVSKSHSRRPGVGRPKG